MNAPQTPAPADADPDGSADATARRTAALASSVPLHQQAGYDAVYEVIRATPGDAWRNALIWRAVEAYRTAAETARTEEGDRYRDLDAQLTRERQQRLAAEAAVRGVRELHSPEEDPRRVRDCQGCRTHVTFTPYEECKTLAALDADQPKETP